MDVRTSSFLKGGNFEGRARTSLGPFLACGQSHPILYAISTIRWIRMTPVFWFSRAPCIEFRRVRDVPSHDLATLSSINARFAVFRFAIFHVDTSREVVSLASSTFLGRSDGVEWLRMELSTS